MPSFLQRVGESGLAAWTGGAAMMSFLGESVVASVKLVRGRAQFRWSDTLMVIQQCGPEALGIVAMINILIGMILAFVGATELTQFGASIYTADLVAVATVREMACIMTGIIMCGRTSAAFAAQLGTMKVNQEIEGFQTFGISPFEFLVLPRMLALILMMPLLCLFANVIAIAGGFLVSTPFDTTLAVARMLYDGFFDRYPQLKIIASHGGGALPYLIGRLGQCFRHIPACRTKTESPPSSYMGRLFADSVVFTTPALDLCLEVFGDDHVLFGTDYPHTIGDPRGCMARANALLGARREKVRGGNAQRIFRF